VKRWLLYRLGGAISCKLGSPSLKAAILDGLAHFGHDCQVKMKVMDSI
jgi:hypothetical protein